MVENELRVGCAVESATRNVLLRRMDWRFLTMPQPSRGFGAGDNTMADAVALVTAIRGDEYDVAALARPKEHLIADVVRRLNPNGWLYIEWQRFASKAGICRQLSRYGIDEVRFYRPWPSLHAAEAWIPLGSPQVSSFFARRLFPPLTDIVAVLSRPRRWASYYSWAFGLRAPNVTIGRNTHHRRSADDTAAFVIQNWRSWTQSMPPKRLSLLLLTGGRRSFNKVVALAFADNRPRPDIAIKFPRELEAVRALSREASILRQVGRRVGNRLGGYPRVLFAAEWNGSFMVAQTAILGRPVLLLIRPGDYRVAAEKGTRWLTEFARYSSNGPPSLEWQNVAKAVLDRLETLLKGHAAELLRTVRAALAAIGPLPQVIEQRDFAPWNLVLDDDGTLGVLDWESAECSGLPYLDLIYFLTMLAFQHAGMPSHKWTAATAAYYIRLSGDQHPMGQTRRALLEEYGRKLDLDPRSVGPLSMLCWAIHCTSELVNFARDNEAEPVGTHLERSVFFCLLNEEVRLYRSGQIASRIEP